jgi:general secretion pathway protein G
MIRPRFADGTRPVAARRRGGFTLVELLVVVVIIGVLIALLLPVIAGAVRNANDARVSAEVQLLSQALAEFKQKYGDYPPSRVVLSETGYYNVADATQLAPGDITYGQLAERSVRYLRKFFPRAIFSTTGPIYNASGWHDFNGNATLETEPYLLEGHECLVFFLGGIPSFSGSGVTGFAKNPVNPFAGDSPNPAVGTTNRMPALFEFRPERLVQDDADGIPGYLDPYATPGSAPTEGNTRFFLYFYGYGNNAYDPNDVNSIFEPLPKQFVTSTGVMASPGPNPYTSGPAVPAGAATVAFSRFVNPDAFQIISAGADGYYGLGGQYSGDATNDKLPVSTEADYVAGDANTQRLMTEARARERDNVTNFTRGRID